MPIIHQNDSLLSAAATSILGGKQIVSLTDPADIRDTAVAYASIIATFCGNATAKEVEKSITTSTKNIKTVFVDGITFEHDLKSYDVYIVNTYDLSQLKNFYGDVNGAELPSGYFVVVVPTAQRMGADMLAGNVLSVVAPEVLNVETGKAIKESGISIKESTNVSDLNQPLVTLKSALTYGRTLEQQSSVDVGDLQHLKTLISKALSQLNSDGKVQKYKLGAISAGLSHTATQNDLGDIMNYLEGAVHTIEDSVPPPVPTPAALDRAYKAGVAMEWSSDNGKTWKSVGKYDPTVKLWHAGFKYRVAGGTNVYDWRAASVKEATVTEHTSSVTYAQAISALGGSAEDEELAVIKRYADCLAIIFKMTSKEVMNDLIAAGA